ncbi:MAG: DNA phosphorothioation-associated putative methyltransferase [Rhodoferax sp.]|nr:DNA phosphorothioation-associated putative methyltransferase [Rhodoferax sp.]
MNMNGVGKKVFDDLYLHTSALKAIEDVPRRTLIEHSFNLLPNDCYEKISVIKLNVKSGRISLLEYIDFDLDPFPTLGDSWLIEPNSTVPVFRTYRASLNPPILHRKELLVANSYPNREVWCKTTQEAESLGLFANTKIIGFKRNWERLIAGMGYELKGTVFSPIGNANASENDAPPNSDAPIQRHLTAISRTSLSAPVQYLVKTGLLSAERSFFDFGCGKGTDVQALQGSGIQAKGWDPHYAPSNDIETADVVNLGFVVNVIEDPAERAEAIHHSFAITAKVLAVSVMLYGPEVPGKPYRDGYITSRKTFQKYFTQSELKDYLEHALGQQVFMVGPGIALIFADKDLEQQFNARRFRRNDFTERLLSARILRTKPERPPRVRVERITQLERQFLECQPVLEKLWKFSLDLGRLPESVEVDFLGEILEKTRSYSRAVRLVHTHFDTSLLDIASKERANELLLYLASMQFEKRPAYKKLEARIQRDIKYFFGDYKAAQTAALQLLMRAASPDELLAACDEASAQGLGWRDTNQSLQFHIEMLERLPVILRAYVNCGLILWEETGAVQLIKIHIGSGKLTLLEFKDFTESPLPLLVKRIKLNIRKQEVEVFEYGSDEYPFPILYRKSRYMHEEMAVYAEQLLFDESLEALNILGDGDFGPSALELQKSLEARRLTIRGFDICGSSSIPDLDAPCGATFVFRDFIECGETQQRLGLRNIPLNPLTYNAIHHLAVSLVDPVVEYFGAIRLTYGFCSSDLAKHIDERIAPKLDQHASHECNRLGKPLCNRLGAAVDFFVEDENMLEVAQWIVQNCVFDRIYYYGADKPLHVSLAETVSRQITLMLPAKQGGQRIPKTLSVEGFLLLQTE